MLMMRLLNLVWNGVKTMGKRHEAALKAKPILQKGAQHLDDAEALEVKGIYAEWEAGVAVKVHEKRIYGDRLYRCLQAHTTQEAWNPVEATSLWAKVLIPVEDDIPEWEQPESTNPYMAGDKVTHNGKTWVSDVDNNVWEPGVYGWSEVA